ncbi:MAG: hypothetical protein HY427_02480 [Candidatus Levybacteria bacterium]|nr:hypothetical protein [Candidatus Levybacteria bacterium]
MERMKIFPLKIHEWLFLFAGLGIILSFPIFGEGALFFWTLAKISYFVGIFFFILDMRKQK